MSHFYGHVQGNRGDVSRGGSKASGYMATAASWQGCVKVNLWHDDKTGVDMAEVRLDRWHGRGVYQILYTGPVSGKGDVSHGRDGANENLR